MAINRYETRRQLVQDEANAIGTNYLRAKVLPSPYATDAANLLRQYVANRLDFFNAGVDQALAGGQQSGGATAVAALVDRDGRGLLHEPRGCF